MSEVSILWFNTHISINTIRLFILANILHLNAWMKNVSPLFCFFLFRIILRLSCAHIHSRCLAFMQFAPPHIEPIRKYQCTIPVYIFLSVLFKDKHLKCFFLSISLYFPPPPVMAFLCLALWRGKPQPCVSPSPHFIIKACCCGEAEGEVWRGWSRAVSIPTPLHWPSQLNDLLTQIHWANMSMIYRKWGQHSERSLDFASSRLFIIHE